MSEAKTIETRKLGLAAFIQINGSKLVGMNGRAFVFESEKQLRDWEIEYANSCCQKHDQSVCELRKLWN